MELTSMVIWFTLCRGWKVLQLSCKRIIVKKCARSVHAPGGCMLFANFKQNRLIRTIINSPGVIK